MSGLKAKPARFTVRNFYPYVNPTLYNRLKNLSLKESVEFPGAEYYAR